MGCVAVLIGEEMTQIFLRTLCAVSSLSLILSSQVWADGSSERVLHRKTIPGDRELVVTQGPLVAATALAGIYAPPHGHQFSGMFSLAVELHSPPAPPLCLWSQLRVCEREAEYDEYEVLDLLVLPERLVLATGEAGSSIRLTEIRIASSTRGASLTGLPPWSLLGASIPNRPGRLGATLRFNDKQSRIEVEVTDHLQHTKQHTSFEQKPDAWEFVSVKQWQEDVP
jgi:hypothetical protein